MQDEERDGKKKRKGKPKRQHPAEGGEAMDHMEILHKAKVAVNKVCGDMSVPKQDTIDSLNEILEMIEPAIECLEEEVEREDNENVEEHGK